MLPVTPSTWRTAASLRRTAGSFSGSLTGLLRRRDPGARDLSQFQNGLTLGSLRLLGRRCGQATGCLLLRTRAAVSLHLSGLRPEVTQLIFLGAPRSDASL